MKKLFLLLIAVLSLSLCASAQTRTVQGTVVDANNDEPLIGVSVTAGTSTNGVMTDIDGRFVIKVPVSVTQLKVSYVGYLPLTVKISDKPLVIRMHQNEENLDEVIVVAYGKSTRASFTGSASVVKAAEIESAQVSNPLNAIKGKVAGVQMSNASGAPGADSPTIRIRGISSISADNDPLIIVDGASYSGSMNSINTNDIESMTVLKDAASTALYGSRGANGVIIITTKRAKVGEARVNVDIKLGSNSRAQQDYNYIKNPAMYYETYFKALKNYGTMVQGMSDASAYNFAITNLISNPNSLTQYGLQYNVYTLPEGQALIGTNGKLNPNATLGRQIGDFWIQPDNWYDAAFKHGLRQEYNVSVAKGTDQGNFFLSAGYLNNEGITPVSGFERYTARLAADTQAKSWLRVAGDFNYSHTKTDMYGEDEGSVASSGNPFALVTALAPIYPLYVRDANGNIRIDDNGLTVYDYGSGNNAGLTRPVFSGNSNAIGAALMDKSYTIANSFSGTGTAEVRFLKDFTVTSNNTVNFYEYGSTSFTNPWYGTYASLGGSLSKGDYRRLSYSLQQLINWGHMFGDHNVAVLLGHEYLWQRTSTLSGSRTKMFDPSNMELAGMILNPMTTSASSDYNVEGYFARAQYDYAQKYFASASFRRDATSIFHPKHRWGNFWSASAAWLMNKENFLEDTSSWLNMLKVKVSYGEMGNDGIGGWLYTNTYSVENSNDEIALVPGTMGNETITWETVGNFNAGVEFSMFNDRLSGSIEGFYRKTSDMLFYFSLPPSMGWTGYYANIGDMANKGVEIDLHGTPYADKDWNWSVDVNFTYYKNKIVRLPEERRTMYCDGIPGFSSSNFYYGEGESLYTYRMIKYAGVDSETGEPLYWKDIYQKDESGNNVLDPVTNEPIVIGEEKIKNPANASYHLHKTALAPIYGGFGTSLSYKDFDLSVNFDYQIGGYCYDSNYMSLMSSPSSGSGIGQNIHADILNAWTPENPNSNIPRYAFGDTFVGYSSDRWLTSASYLSLSNIVFGYTLPSKLTQKIQVNKVRFYFNADNVWLWSKRQGLDPRLSISGGGNSSFYSPIRTLSGGVNIAF